MNKRMMSPLTERDIWEKLETIETKIESIEKTKMSTLFRLFSWAGIGFVFASLSFLILIEETISPYVLMFVGGLLMIVGVLLANIFRK